MADLSIHFCDIKFCNPFILSTSICSNSTEMLGRAFDLGWGGAVIRTTSLDLANRKLNSPIISGYYSEEGKLIAVQRIDDVQQHIDAVQGEIKILKRAYPDKVIIANIEVNLNENIEGLIRRLETAGTDIIECSLNTFRLNGIDYVQAICRMIQRIREVSKSIPVIIKIPPLFTDIPYAAQSIKNSGANGITAINPIKSLIGIDIDNFIPYPNVNGSSVFGELSGYAIKPIALRCVGEIAQTVDISIGAAGGISKWQDAVEFILVGAKSLQVCSEVMKSGYGIIRDLIEGMKQYLDQKGFTNLEQLVGKSLPYIKRTSHDFQDSEFQVSCTINKHQCIKCGACYISCRDNGFQAIELDMDKLPVINSRRCRGCNLCSTICPVKDCIEIKKFVKKK
ncbi:NAD-dependent dihydropyrimidine dehydrogenase subunit PreA [Candidatus Formimonas warabiya]|uniref:dihydrouracil dehydrogenase (NAD(+)) n=1 Tax=Formimonas warabiya TaxID=1761012 RepID=A0A3G1KQB9_FORW1|nr:NAD-dependent dihydropyrimidine dehydrogenase subunit PreA [Candidatus Formimonas warabiya]ATW24638.1 hypothetical protein DCMF_07460 [Candidatus Formimonas warabiya]